MNKDNKYVKGTYWALIITFTVLYIAIAFVSTLHAVAFFSIGNKLGMAILLAGAYEIGQMAVLFSLLMTHHKNKFLAWFMMILLTTLQVTANVYATFMFMEGGGGTDWQYWQRSILFWMEADGSEMYKITIAWIQGALLPIVALGLTALVVDNIKLMRGDVDLEYYQDEDEEEWEEGELGILDDEFISSISPNDELMEAGKRFKDALEDKPLLNMDGSESLMDDPSEKRALKYASAKHKENVENEEDFSDEPSALANSQYREELETVKEAPGGVYAPGQGTYEPEKAEFEFEKDYILPPSENQDQDKIDPLPDDWKKGIDSALGKTPDEAIGDAHKDEGFDELAEIGEEIDLKPVNTPRGWHFKKEFIDDDGNIFQKGKFVGRMEGEVPETSKKA